MRSTFLPLRGYMVIAAVILLVISVSLGARSGPLASAPAARIPFGGSTNDGPAIFVAQIYSPTILVLSARGKILSTLTARYPSSSLASDSDGDLYVSANAKQNAIQVFKPPQYFFTDIVLPKGQEALGVAVDARRGIIAIMSGHVDGGSEVSEISFYRRGSVSPCRVIREQSSNFVFDGGGGFDRAGALYTPVDTFAGNKVVSILGGCGAGRVRELTFLHPFQITQGMMFDKNDDFVIQGTLSPNVSPIYTYRHPQNGQFGNPTATTTLPLYRGHAQGFGGLVTDGEHLLGAGYHDAAQYAYPSGKGPEWILTGIAGVSSIALVHPEIP